MPDPKPTQDHSQSDSDFAANGSNTSTPRAKIVEARPGEPGSDLELGFEKAFLRKLELEPQQAIALYERLTRLDLEVKTAHMVMLAVAAAIVIQAVFLIVSPLFFSLNLLIACIGLLTRRYRRGDSASESGEQDPDP